MVSLIISSAGSCVLPVAGPRRFGGRRLPVVAAPGHHCTGLIAGWSLDTSTTAGLGSLRPGKLLSTGASPWALKAAGLPPSSAPGDEEDGEEDSELVRQFKVALMAGQILPAETNYMELPGLHDQVVIGDLAERSFALWVDVANRLRPPSDSKIHEGLHHCGEVFVAAKVRNRAISWKRARDLAEGLELLRRIVSSALQAPLPLTWTWYAVVPMEYVSKAALCLMLQHTCRTVENDIRSMFHDERTN